MKRSDLEVHLNTEFTWSLLVHLCRVAGDTVWSHRASDIPSNVYWQFRPRSSRLANKTQRKTLDGMSPALWDHTVLPATRHKW